MSTRSADNMPMLYLLDRRSLVQTCALDGTATFGSLAAAEAQLLVDAPQLSPVHGRFYPEDGRWYYENLNPTVGTWVGNIFLGRERSASSGSRLRISSTTASPASQPVPLEPGTILRVTNTDGTPSAVLFFAGSSAPRSGWTRQTLPQDSETKVQPRIAPDCGAIFFYGKSGWAVKCDQSSDVLVNGKTVTMPVYLGDMDVIQLGKRVVFFSGGMLHHQIGTIVTSTMGSVSPAASLPERKGGLKITPSAAGTSAPKPAPVPAPVATPYFAPIPVMPVPPVPSFTPRPAAYVGKDVLQIRIASRDVWAHMKKITLLKDITMDIYAGELVLILGGSGAGKTTFINAVMGYEPANGTILFNGISIYDEYEKMKRFIGFVPQQDLMRESDTVHDTLKNAGEMKLPVTISPAELEQRVREVQTLLGLEREQDSLVRKLSGGQRKRLSIAQEYIGNPSLFFLDEPDSGLDGVMAKELFNNLRTIANTGKIVMVITHGPDRAADLFDKVIVLAKDTRDNCGHLAFFGSVPEAYRFFDTDSLEGVVRKINRRDEGGDGLSDYYIEKFAREGR